MFKSTRGPIVGSWAAVSCWRRSYVCVYVYIGTCGLVAMTSASHAEGRQFDPGQVYLCVNATARVQYTPGQDRTGDLQRVRLTS